MDNLKVKDTYVHFHGAPERGRVLMVASSPAVSRKTGWPIGFWMAELTHPMLAFQEAGYEVTLASTEGGELLADAYSDPRDESGYSAHDIISLGYLQKPAFLSLLKDTPGISQLPNESYDAIFLVGGQGPMDTFRGNKVLEGLVRDFLEAGKPTGIVCHATCLLLEARGSDGEFLVKGKTWTGFANSEEDYADQAVGRVLQPYRIETEARKIPGTKFRVSGAFRSHAIADGNLVTGQQQNSGAAVAKMMLDQLTPKGS